jgi:hypothetical protein
MTVRIVHSGWDRELSRGLAADSSDIRIVCPFIKRKAAERLLERGRPDLLRVVTRFNLIDFSEGVSDLKALRFLREQGAQIRGVKRLHAKLYLFGGRRVIATSANLTEAALTRNHEFGFVATDRNIVTACRRYFDGIWVEAGADLSVDQLARWEEEISRHLSRGTRIPSVSGLGDEGVEIGLHVEPPAPPPPVSEATQAFVKFFGKSSDNRAPRSTAVLDEVERSGCHWACSYPKNSRPRKVRDGAIMFLGRMVRDPADILVFGRAVGLEHEPGRDDATAEDIAARSWKASWPHYVRVHHPEFVDGELANGISLNELMATLRSDAFATTQRNARERNGRNTNPRRAYPRHPAVELSEHGRAWLNERFELALSEHGQLDASALNRLDWPSVETGEHRPHSAR